MARPDLRSSRSAAGTLAALLLLPLLSGCGQEPRQALEAPPVQLVPLGRSDTQTGFWFNPRMHDPSEKTWLGRAVAERGHREGEAALDHLARHPATALHIARKLVQTFVADQPPPALVERLAQVFLAEDGQTVPVLRALFTSDAFWAPEHRGSKFKTPYHYALSALRAGDWRPASLQPVVLSLAAQGMPLFGCPTPDGYKNTETAWLNPDGMTKRINLATQLAAGRLLNEPLSPAAGSLVGIAHRIADLTQRKTQRREAIGIHIDLQLPCAGTEGGQLPLADQRLLETGLTEDKDVVAWVRSLEADALH